MRPFPSRYYDAERARREYAPMEIPDEAPLSYEEKKITDLTAQRDRALEAVEVKTVQLDETTRKMWQLDAQLTEALEAAEKLRESLEKAARDFVSANGTRPEWWTSVLDLYQAKRALSATEPATVEPHSKSEFRRLEIQRESIELPKCDHCGAIACGTDCDGSSHYTADKKE